MSNHRELSKLFFLHIIFAVIVAGLLFLPLAKESLWWREFFNAGHTFLFLYVSLVLHFWLEKNFRFRNSAALYFFIFAIGLSLGFLIEVTQSFLQREASSEDMYRNFFGIMAGLGFVLQKRQKVQHYKILATAFSFGFLLLGSFSLLQISEHYIRRDLAFPMLTQFEENWSSSFVRLNQADFLEKTKSINDAKVNLFPIKFNPSRYPGISIVEPEKNWSSYQRLRLKVVSANTENVALVLRVHDKTHNQKFNDRFNQTYFIHLGANEIVIDLNAVRDAPVNRALDMANIAGVKIFLIGPKMPVVLDVSNLFLEN